MATTEEILKDLINKVNLRTRFNVQDNMVEQLIKQEIQGAIFDAIDDINSFAPATAHTLESIYESTDTRWQRLLLLGACKNSIQILVFDWTASGLSAAIDQFEVINRLEDYRALLNGLTEEFEKLLERLKASTAVISSVASFRTLPSKRRGTSPAQEAYSRRYYNNYQASYNHRKG